MKGRVKWWNDNKGYGFISTETQSDIFVHYTSISSEGFKTLVEDQEVTFDLVDGPKGSQAINVQKGETK